MTQILVIHIYVTLKVFVMALMHIAIIIPSNSNGILWYNINVERTCEDVYSLEIILYLYTLFFFYKECVFLLLATLSFLTFVKFLF